MSRAQFIIVGLLVSLSAAMLAAKPSDDNGKIWVAIKPVQCLGNPWEKEWMAQHKNRADKYPRRKEFVLIKNYFVKHKIPVIQIRQKAFVRGDALCQACDCPRGDTIYLLTYARHTPELVKLGYTQRAPASDVITQK